MFDLFEDRRSDACLLLMHTGKNDESNIYDGYIDIYTKKCCYKIATCFQWQNDCFTSYNYSKTLVQMTHSNKLVMWYKTITYSKRCACLSKLHVKKTSILIFRNDPDFIVLLSMSQVTATAAKANITRNRRPWGNLIFCPRILLASMYWCEWSEV